MTAKPSCNTTPFPAANITSIHVLLNMQLMAKLTGDRWLMPTAIFSSYTGLKTPEKPYLQLEPMKTGNYTLRLKQNPLDSPYPAANAVNVIINHVNGRETVTVDQGLSENLLGNYTLDNQSWVKILAKSSDDSDRIVFGSLELTGNTGETDVVSANRVADQVLDTSQVGLVVKDFWKQISHSGKSKRPIIACLRHS